MYNAYKKPCPITALNAATGAQDKAPGDTTSYEKPILGFGDICISWNQRTYRMYTICNIVDLRRQRRGHALTRKGPIGRSENAGRAWEKTRSRLEHETQTNKSSDGPIHHQFINPKMETPIRIANLPIGPNSHVSDVAVKNAR